MKKQTKKKKKLLWQGEGVMAGGIGEWSIYIMEGKFVS